MRKLYMKFGRKAAKYAWFLRAQRAFSIESMLFQSSQCEFSKFLESYVLEFWNFLKVSFQNLPDAKLFNRLYLLHIGFEFCTRHAHTKDVPVSNPITSHNVFVTWSWKVLNVIDHYFSHYHMCKIIISVPLWINDPSSARQACQTSWSKSITAKEEKRIQCCAGLIP